MGNYAEIVKASSPQAFSGGYKDVVFFAPVADFLVLQKPAGPFTNPGDSLKIATAHTFTSPAGFFSWATKQASIVITGDPQGDPGAQQMRYSCVFTILGDSASTQEQVEALLNDNVVMLVKEANCLENDSYVQLGDECVQPDFTATFDSGNSREGVKAYTITAAVTGKKFFYTGAVTQAS